MNNGEQFEEYLPSLQICLRKGYIFKRNKEEISRGNKNFFDKSEFDLIVLDCSSIYM